MDTPSMDTPLVVRAYNLGLKAVANFHTVLSPEQVAYYEQHLEEIPDALQRAFVVPQAFTFLADLGTITVPNDYNHATRLATFLAANRRLFYGPDGNITDAKFPNPSRILKPGDKLRVRAFKQNTKGTTSSEERLAFLRTQNAVFTGAQGASLVFEQKRRQLPRGYWYSSFAFDEPERLCAVAGGSLLVPFLRAHSVGAFRFSLGDFEGPWYDRDALLCFCDL
jgi:hypothetical protein